ncbi:PREDICTED: ubiquitin-like-conjugating enzyme ATG10 [Priapulus caudatus]|uniref:Ubiquitin-like-conjugating enzyme ATG10 n=1 Tax=Priapulus caudatus TaxID=37621 RepID=A0ABM1FBA0_PRICU|nr:PREDICTED: ubiquitin-like-conjugating enzyme ATG10 [Priapulus caudatus]
MAGSISWNNFMEDVVKLQQHSNCISDSWQLISSTADPAQSYLCKKFQKLYRLPAISTTTMLPSDEQVIGWKIGDDEQSVGNCSAMTTTTWSHGDNKHIAQLCSCEYHVVYSASYGVPVAYFNLCRTNGCLLSLEEVWYLLPEEAARHDKWTFVTQQEHPVLARPFFQLHPCHTAAFMSRVGKSRNYVATWLSVIGSAIGLDVDLSYATLT